LNSFCNEFTQYLSMSLICVQKNVQTSVGLKNDYCPVSLVQLVEKLYYIYTEDWDSNFGHLIYLFKG
jgi:hypothetical protein